MQIQINFGSVPASDSLEAHVRDRLDREISRFGQDVTRIEVHLGDENSHKSGPADKRCLIEARPRGMDPLVVEHHASDLFDAVTESAGKMRRALATRFERRDQTR